MIKNTWRFIENVIQVILLVILAKELSSMDHVKCHQAKSINLAGPAIFACARISIGPQIGMSAGLLSARRDACFILGASKVTKLDVAVGVDHHILMFDITMEDTCIM